MPLEVINWDQYFMGVALLSAKRSKDPSTQVGACIVSPDKRLISVGWNGMPSSKLHNNDLVFPWGKKSKNELENKYLYVVHAEPNAIFHAKESVRGCVMYLTWYPCSECAKTIVQSGISRLVFLHRNTSDRYRVSMEAADTLFSLGGVVCEKYQEAENIITLNFTTPKE